MLTVRHSLRRRLLVAHLLVIGVGVIVLFGATVTVAPSLFHQSMMGMMEMSGGMMGGMMAGVDQALTNAFRAAILQALLLSTVAAIVAAVAVSLVVSSRLVSPIQGLVGASRRIAAGHSAERVPVTADDELGSLAAQFNQMAVELEGAERRRVALIGDVAHELRTPLATMEGYIEGVLDGVVEPKPETWAMLHDEVGRLRRLVQDLQDLSRAEARQLPLSLRPMAPDELIAQAVARIEPQFADKGVRLKTVVTPDLPRVQADSDRIIQVLINLLGNALRYTPAPGTVTVAAERVNATIAFHIVDTGLGIAPEHLPHLFERFYRVDKARARALGGSGIGLTIAKAIIEAHDGQIWVSSPGLGHGATFSFTLPIVT
jgi:two-component system, OmpR family, sensor histidine kinase BaeS